MRSSLLLFLLVALAGCAGTVGPIAGPPLPSPLLEPPPPPPLSVLDAPEFREVEPVEPPPVPERVIDRRSVFARANAIDWALANGLTVVYLRDPTVDGYHARIVMVRDGAGSGGEASWGRLAGRGQGGEWVAAGRSDGLGALLDDIALALTDASRGAAPTRSYVSAATRVFLLGAREPAWVEPAVAATLGRLRPSSPRGPAPGPDPDGGVSAGWTDLPAVRVLDQLLVDRAGPGASGVLGVDLERGRVRVLSDAEDALPAGVSDDAIRVARERAAAAARTPQGRLEAFAALYAVPGRFRPSRDPAEAAALPARIERTPPAAVTALLRRLSEAR